MGRPLGSKNRPKEEPGPGPIKQSEEVATAPRRGMPGPNIPQPLRALPDSLLGRAALRLGGGLDDIKQSEWRANILEIHMVSGAFGRFDVRSL